MCSFSCRACRQTSFYWDWIAEDLKGIAKVADINCDDEKNYKYCDEIVQCSYGFPGDLNYFKLNLNENINVFEFNRDQPMFYN